MVTVPVPAYHGAQQLGAVKPNVARTDPQRLQAPDLSFGGRMLAQLGQNLAGLSAQLQARSDDMWLVEANREITEKLKSYNDPSGFRSQHGRNAAGLTDAMNKDWTTFSDHISKTYRGKLSPRSWRALDRTLQTKGLSVNSSVTTHELNEVEKQIIAGLEATLDLHKTEYATAISPNLAVQYANVEGAASATIGDRTFDDNFQRGILEINNTVAQIAAKAGLTEASAKQLALSHTTGFVAQRVSLLSAEDAEAASNFLDLSFNAGYIDGAKHAELSAALTPLVETARAGRQAIAAMNTDLIAKQQKELLSTVEGMSQRERDRQLEIYQRSAGRAPSQSGFIPAFKTGFQGFQTAGAAHGLTIRISSGYRSPTQQAQIIAGNMLKYTYNGPNGSVPVTQDMVDQWIADSRGGDANAILAGQKWASMFDNMTKPDGSKFRSWVAMPGYSRHQHGVAADISVNGKRVSDLSAEEKELLVQLAHQNGLHFPLGNEDWHVELAGAGGVGSRIAVDPNGLIPGQQQLVDAVMNSKTDSERRIATQALGKYTETNAAIDASRVAYEGNAFETASAALYEAQDGIASGEVSLNDVVSLEQFAQMGGANQEDINAIFNRIQNGDLITTDMSKGSVYRGMMETLTSGASVDEVQAAYNKVTGTSEWMFNVSNEDKQAITGLVQNYGNIKVPALTTLRSNVEIRARELLVDSGMKANSDEYKVALDRLTDKLYRKLAQYSETTGKEVTASDNVVSSLMDELLQQYQTSEGSEPLIGAMMVEQAVAKAGGDHNLAVTSMIDDGLNLTAPDGSVIPVTSDLALVVWEAVKEVVAETGRPATAVDFLDALHDVVMREEGQLGEGQTLGSPVAMSGFEAALAEDARVKSLLYQPEASQVSEAPSGTGLEIGVEAGRGVTTAILPGVEAEFVTEFTKNQYGDFIDNIPEGLSIDQMAEWLRNNAPELRQHQIDLFIDRARGTFKKQQGIK